MDRHWWVQYVLHRTYGITGAERLALVYMVYEMNHDAVCCMNPEKLSVVLSVPVEQGGEVLDSLLDKQFVTHHATLNGETFYRMAARI